MNANKKRLMADPGRVRKGVLNMILLLMLWGLLAAGTAQAVELYVNVSRPDDSGDGRSWETAKKTIQAAVTAAESGDEIWVAAGTYTGTSSPVVTMKDGVSLYGGFVGTETTRTARNWTTNQTAVDGISIYQCVVGANNATLDGFTIQNGSAETGGGMYNESVSPTVANCTFRANSATGGGGGGAGMHNVVSSSPTVTNCTFTENVSAGDGGGMANDNGSSPAVFGCTFERNTASSCGGGMDNDFSCNSTVTNCMFVENTADQDGGGMENWDSAPILTNCIFIGNRTLAGVYGGGAIANATSTPSLINCTLVGNQSNSNGGALALYMTSSATLINCILWSNSASTAGNEIFGSPAVTYSCIDGGFEGTGNISSDPLFVDAENGDLRLYSGSPCIDTGTSTGAPSTDIAGVSRPQGAGYDMGAYEGAGAAIWYVMPTGEGSGTSWADAAGSIQAAVTAAESGDEIWVAAGTYTGTSSPVVTLKEGVSLYGGFVGTETTHTARNWTTNQTVVDGISIYQCVIGANNATLDGFTIQNGFAETGGGMYNESVSPTVANCTFRANSATGNGGAGMHNVMSSSPTVTNCTFTENVSAGDGGGMANDIDSSPSVLGCTFERNAAFSCGGGMDNDFSCNSTVTKCMFVENTADYDGGAMENWDSSPILTNCIFFGNRTVVGSHGGGAMANANSTPSLINCTFVGNESNSNGGALALYFSSSPTLVNCVLWNNSASLSGNEIFNEDSGSPAVTYSCIEGGFEGTGNISSDPLFVDAENADLRLQAGSPCIDTGTATGAPSTDIAGVARPQGTGYDMGAYEGALAPLPLSAWPLAVLLMAVGAVALKNGARRQRIK